MYPFASLISTLTQIFKNLQTLTKLNTMWPNYTLLTKKILFDQIKPNLTIFDPIWYIFIYFGQSEPFWNILTKYDLIGHNLTYLHPFDPKNPNFSHQKKFDIFWPFWLKLTKLDINYPTYTLFPQWYPHWPKQSKIDPF